MDQDIIKTIIEHIFTHTGCTISSLDFVEENSMLWCAISTPDSRFIIGRDGETLRSLNHLVRKILEKEVAESETMNLFVDVNGYQKKHFDNLKNTAHMYAERARYFKSNVELDPMAAPDRRIIHMFLENAKNIATESTGYGPERRVVVKYITSDQDPTV
jgi:predicted RNA-binding protein Jag